jgi:hypothetical protein
MATQWEQPVRQFAGPALACRILPVPACHTIAVTFLGSWLGYGPVLASRHGKLSVTWWHHHGIFIHFSLFRGMKIGKIYISLILIAFIIIHNNWEDKKRVYTYIYKPLFWLLGLIQKQITLCILYGCVWHLHWAGMNFADAYRLRLRSRSSCWLLLRPVKSQS